MTRAAVERVVRSAYAARKAGELAAACGHFAEDGRFSIAGDRLASPIAGSAEGHEAIRAALAGVMGALDWVSHDIVELLVEGDRAAVRSRATVRAKATGEEVETEMLDLIQVRDGKIISFHQFCDTARAAQLLASVPGSG
jgi:ketosteroid isomerase-like protein